MNMERIEAIDREGIYRLMHALSRNCDLWITGWEKIKDVPNPSIPLLVPHIRNVSLAIGKLVGLYNVLLHMNAGLEDVPEEIIQLVQKYQAIWDQF